VIEYVWVGYTFTSNVLAEPTCVGASFTKGSLVKGERDTLNPLRFTGKPSVTAPSIAMEPGIEIGSTAVT
jgi:hypothetical protein